jgi:hypothetical protein
MSNDNDLVDAIGDAEDRATVLDDRNEIENRVVYRWLRAHELHRGRHDHLVIGDEILPLAWRNRTLKFFDKASADHFVRSLKADHHATHALRSLKSSMTMHSLGAHTDDAFFGQLSSALVCGQIWVIRAEPIANKMVGKTDAKVFDALNPKFGTRIDFAAIAKLEVGQWLRGYVPTGAGVVIGASGLTIASGFDVGQWSAKQMEAMGIPDALRVKLAPFCKHSFKGKTVAQVAAVVAKIGPVPLITKAEADLCDGLVFSEILKTAIADWDRQRSASVPSFGAMPGGWQTVWLSRNYQEGRRPKSSAARDFRKMALAGRWADAVAALKRYTEYVERASAEADRLAAEMPPRETPNASTASSPLLGPIPVRLR